LQNTDTNYNDNIPPKHAALIFGNAVQLAAWQNFTAQLGCTISDGDALANSANHCDDAINFDLLLIDLLSKTDQHPKQLSNISAYLNARNAEAIVWTDLQGLDEAYAILPVSQCHFLVDAADAEAMLIMSKAIRRGKMDLVHGSNRQMEFSALHRISDELADFAKTLARIAEQDEDVPSGGVAERPVSFRPAPTAIMQPLVSPAAEPEHQISATYIREVIKLRRLRERYFDAELFADPAWDILLDLFAARFEGVAVSVSSLCIAASVPATTALRWISAMTTNGILLRRHDPNDARRVFIELSGEMMLQMTAYFAETQRRGRQPAHQPV
jgi:hypothetical protein